MTTIAFVERKNDIDQIRNKDAILIFLDNDSPKKHRLYRSKDDYVSTDKLYEVNRKAINWFKTWSAIPICEGKNFKELFIYKGVSLWWFVDFWLFYHELHRMNIKDIIQAIYIIDEVVRKEKPDKIIRINNGSVFSETLALYAKKKGIPLIDIGNQKILDKIRPSILEWLKYRKFYTRRIISKIFSKKPEKVDIMLVGLASHWATHTSPLTATTKEDILLQPIIDYLEEHNIPFLNTDVDFTPTSGIPLFLERRTFAIPIELYIDRRVRKITKEQKKKLYTEYLSHKKEISDSLVFDGINLWPLLEKRFEFVFCHRLPEGIMWLEAYINAIREHDPKSLLIIDENDFPGRAAVIAGRMERKKVVGLQHGTISEFCFDYNHLENEVSRDLDYHSPYIPLPQKTAVYGKNTEQILIKHGHLPAYSIVTTGQPRYDIINKLCATLKKEDVCAEFGLNPEKKIILFITQPYKDRFVFADNAFCVLREVCSNHQIVLKPHPRESDYQTYKTIAKKNNLDIRIIAQNLFKLLFIADVVVQRDSTVGLEAMLFKKSLICAYIFYEGIAEADFFLRSGCRIARTMPNLKKHLIQATSGEDNERYIVAQTEFIKNEIYNDGGATKRVIELLLK